ncbi:MAG: AAA family ATPase [Sarcina sp.]
MKKVGAILGKFYPMHKGHLGMIEGVAKDFDKLYVFVCYTEGETIPVDMRNSWVKKAVSNLPNVEVLNILEQLGSSEDGRASDENVSATWAKWLMRKYPDITHFVGSEEYVNMMAKSVDIDSVIYDMNREKVPMSATKVRRDFNGMKDNLAHDDIKDEYVYRVAIVGLDSCGKSTLTHWLSNKFDCEVVNEYGRDYCALHASPDDGVDNFITRKDLEEIAYGHHMLMLAAVRNAWKKGKRLVISDTEHIVTQGFSERYFGERNKRIQDMINFQHYDLFIYCDLLPLEDDGTRRIVGQDERIENDKKLRKMFEENVKDGRLLFVESGWNERKIQSMNSIVNLVRGCA